MEDTNSSAMDHNEKDPDENLPWTHHKLNTRFRLPPVDEEMPEKIFALDESDDSQGQDTMIWKSSEKDSVEILKDGVKEVQAKISEGFDGFSNPFQGAKEFEKLRSDTRTKEFFNDPNYLKLISDLQQNPKSMVEKLKDQRVKTTVSVLLGIDISGPAGDFNDDGKMDTPTAAPEPPKHKEESMEVELTEGGKKKEEENFSSVRMDDQFFIELIGMNLEQFFSSPPFNWGEENIPSSSCIQKYK